MFGIFWYLQGLWFIHPETRLVSTGWFLAEGQLPSGLGGFFCFRRLLCNQGQGNKSSVSGSFYWYFLASSRYHQLSVANCFFEVCRFLVRIPQERYHRRW